MLSLLLQAEQLKPRRTIRHKLHPLHERGSNCIRLAAGDLRRQRHKEFVYSFRRQKLSKQCGSTFVEEHSYPNCKYSNGRTTNGAMLPPVVSTAFISTEANSVAPALASSSLPAEVVITTVRTPGVRKIALSNSSLPLPLTITTSGNSGLCCSTFTRYSVYKCFASG